MGFADNLKESRLNAKLSQEEAAQAISMTRPIYRQLETGERQPTLKELKAISELFGQRIEVLIGQNSIDPDLPDNRPMNDVDSPKYKNLILYLAQKIGAQPNVGETVFYKLLYFTETLSLARNNKVIVGEKFYKMQYGPVPASFKPITEEMISANELDKVQGKYFTYMQTKYLPRIVSTGLADNEVEIVNEIVERLGSKTATELSDLSHKDAPWIETADGDVIDLSLIEKTENRWSYEMGRAHTPAS